MIGKPFGEGFGLEHAVTLISKHFLNSADAREADKIVSIDIIAATGNRIHPEDLNKVMGATEQAFQVRLCPRSVCPHCQSRRSSQVLLRTVRRGRCRHLGTMEAAR